MIFPLGGSFFTTFGRGAGRGFGKRFMTRCGATCGRRWGSNDSPAPGLLIVNRSKRPKKGGRGYDPGKQIKGRKRHLLGDTLGLVLAVVVHAANIPDCHGAKLVLERLKHKFSRLRLIWADGAYAGHLSPWVRGLRVWRKLRLEIVKRTDKIQDFVVQPNRWVVEWTFGWLNRSRRLSKDYEYLPAASEAMIHVAMINLMVRRLARKQTS
jgi:putative transposase